MTKDDVYDALNAAWVKLGHIQRRTTPVASHGLHDLARGAEDDIAKAVGALKSVDVPYRDHEAETISRAVS